ALRVLFVTFISFHNMLKENRSFWRAVSSLFRHTIELLVLGADVVRNQISS
ncbi:hypothetical protein ACJX0J_006698, partial [Zea mays]